MIVAIDSVGFVIFGRHGLYIRAVAPTFTFGTRMRTGKEPAVAVIGRSRRSVTRRQHYGAIRRRLWCPVKITFKSIEMSMIKQVPNYANEMVINGV